MKYLLIMVASLLITLQAGAADNKFVCVAFGTDKAVTLQTLKNTFGEPNSNENGSLVYYDQLWKGYRFSKIVFGFEDEAKGGYFNQARFFLVSDTRDSAVAEREKMAKELEEEYDLTYDFEEDGNKFYNGGTSPAGIGYLFTLYTTKREGKWTTELRFGAFHKLKKKQ